MAEAAPKYNLLLISIDTLRADHLHCYGYDRDTSPHLDQLAKEGVLFENVTAAAPWTVPSHMSMFTALYPSVHGVVDFTRELGEGVPTLAGCLAESGYVTAAFVTSACMNHLFGFNRGFESYDDYTVNQVVDNVEPLKHQVEATGGDWRIATGHVITNRGTKWLTAHAHSNQKFFLFLHYFDCHYDYKPPPPYDKKFDPDYNGKENGSDILQREADILKFISVMDLAHMMALYDGDIAETDENVGKVLQLLQDLGLSEKTLVIVLSDHGEGFLEHGKIRHGNSMYEELLHVPLIMRLPGVIPAGKRVAGNVSHVDLLPTVLGLLDLPGALQQVQGIDLSPVILGGEPVPKRLIYSELAYHEPCLRAVRWENHKLFGTMGTLAGAQLEELVGGRERVIANWTQLTEDSCPKDVIQAFIEGPIPIPGTTPGEVQPNTDLLQRLKSLGYTQ